MPSKPGCTELRLAGFVDSQSSTVSVNPGIDDFAAVMTLICLLVTRCRRVGRFTSRSEHLYAIRITHLNGLDRSMNRVPINAPLWMEESSMATIRRDLLTDCYAGPYYLPGEFVPAGRYCELDSHREILLLQPDALPASCDGRVAVYVPSPRTWEDVAASRSTGVARPMAAAGRYPC